MDSQTEMFLQIVRQELKAQTTILTATMDEKLKPLAEENKILTDEVTKLKTKVHNLERDIRKNNIILHGLEETEENSSELMELVIETLNSVGKGTKIHEFDKWEISDVRRLGKKQEQKRRPVLMKLTLAWRKIEILKNNKYLPENIYATEDFPKDILQIRKELKQKQKEEIEKGNVALLKYDRIIIKGKENPDKSKEKRKHQANKPRKRRLYKRVTELRNALKEIKWDILGLCETRRLGTNINEYDDFILFSVGETKGQYGVGFLVKKELKKHILEFKGISERVAVLRLKIPGYKDNWTIIQVYAPTDSAEETKKDILYEQLSLTIGQADKNMIVMGDFNGKIGTQQQGEEATIGNYGIGKRNGNGERVVSMAKENNLALLSSFFKNKPERKWTWKSPDGVYKNEIDHIATNQRKVFMNVEVINQFNFYTNHRMVRATLYPKARNKTRRHFNFHQHTLQHTRNRNTSDPSDFQNTYDRETSEMFNTTTTTKERKDVLSSKTKTLIAERKELFKMKKDPTTSKAITKLSKEISNSIRKDKENRKMDSINYHIARTGGIRKALKDLQESKAWIPRIKNKDKKQTTKRTSILNTATSFYKDLLCTQVKTSKKHKPYSKISTMKSSRPY
ncbi:uncharacterized protein LOC134677293 [Cydia fagiglandana]|uniref:uncharacterized protein LOC134677293 n=1 Tax=Cydia fagiglandana TaxID=1458189 RepID=UPI002FEDF67A